MRSVPAPPSTGSSTAAPWAEAVRDVASRSGIDLAVGLSTESAAERLRQFGPNTLRAERSRPWWRVVLDQLADWMIGLLAVAALVSAVSGEWHDAVLILLIVVANSVIGFVQHQRAEQAVAALKRLSEPVSHVLREGRVAQLAVADLVPGDLVELTRGNLVPADGRLISAAELEIDEAPLTGESLPIAKQLDPVHLSTVLADRTNMVYAGTSVAQGRARFLVIATGQATELGRIAELLSQADPGATPLELRLGTLSRQLAVLVVVLCVLTYFLGRIRLHDMPWQEMLLTSVSLAVAAVPEGLPAIITVALALGSQQMARRRAIVRQLSAVETLGSVDVICSDKTGTLTQNKMSVSEVIPCDDSRELTEDFVSALALCNDAELSADGQVLGSATETALLHAVRAAGLDAAELRRMLPRVAEIPFDSRRKWMATLHDHDDRWRLLLVKGSAEAVLARSSRLAGAERAQPLTPEARSYWEQEVRRWAEQGRRVLAVARGKTSLVTHAIVEADAVDLEFLGLVSLLDPPRPEAAEAIAECRAAGIRAVMITGDHPATALAIARSLGLANDDSEVITGPELEALSDAQLVERVAEVSVFARVSPEHKLRIVRAHQARESIVAMTGDGVNDAPALKQAEIGIAMGITGSDVSKEAARMILADDNFATIVAAVEQGRVVYDNIRRFVRYLLTSNASELLVILAAIAIGLPLPLAAVHLLWINLVTDGLPALALGFERAERDVMRRKPRGRAAAILNGTMVREIIVAGTWMGSASLALYAWLLLRPHSPGDTVDALACARTGVFVTLALMQLSLVLALRSQRESFFSLGWRSNDRLHAAVVVGIVLQLLLVYFRPLGAYFRTVPLSMSDLALCLATAATPFVLVELMKLVGRRRRLSYESPSNNYESRSKSPST